MACLICLADNFTDGVILDSGSPWFEFYKFCIGVNIHADDIPRKLCGDCQYQLKKFTNFKKNALRSANLWKSFIKNEENYKLFNVQRNKGNENDLFNDCVDVDDIFCEDAEGDKEVVKDFLNQSRKKDIVLENKDIKWDIDVTKVKIENYDDNLIDTKIAIENSCDEHNFMCLKKEDEQISTRKSEIDNGNFSYDFIEDKRYRTNKETIRRKRQNPEKYINKKKQEAPSRDCGLCDKTFTKAEELYQHLAVHSTNNDLRCELCDYKGGDFADMVSHRLMHLSKEYKVEIKCHLCYKRCIVPTRLQFHYRTVHLNKKGGKCTLCSKQFSNYKKWTNHERLHITEGFICDICGRRFLFRHEIIDHLKYHNEENSFICDMCGRGFKRSSNLKLHLQTRHDYSKVKCTHCNKIFKNTVSLKYHLREVTCEKPYKCEICSKCYRAPSLLKSHMIWHQDVRSYVCDDCGLTYKSKQALKTHTSKHTGHRPHKCNQCTRCFATSSQLKIHTSLHTGVRRHKCPHCPRSFHGKKDMLTHVEKCRNTFNSKLKNPVTTPKY